jgi:putative oxidoreductase
MENKSRYTNLVARILLGIVFLASGSMKIAAWSAVVGMAGAKGLPFPAFSISLAAAIEIAGALMLFLGYHARFAAIALFVFLIPTTLLFHNFWAAHGVEQQMQLVNFLKNLAIMGGLLLVAGQGSRPISIGPRTT